jgi:hypothetical protein
VAERVRAAIRSGELSDGFEVASCCFHRPLSEAAHNNVLAVIIILVMELCLRRTRLMISNRHTSSRCMPRLSTLERLAHSEHQAPGGRTNL